MEAIANALETGSSKIAIVTSLGAVLSIDRSAHPRYDRIRDLVLGHDAMRQGCEDPLALVRAMLSPDFVDPDEEPGEVLRDVVLARKGRHALVATTACPQHCSTQPHEHTRSIVLRWPDEAPGMDPALVALLGTMLDMHPHEPTVWQPHAALALALLQRTKYDPAPLLHWMGEGLLRPDAHGNMVVWPTDQAHVVSLLPTHRAPFGCLVDQIDAIPNRGSDMKLLITPTGGRR